MTRRGTKPSKSAAASPVADAAPPAQPEPTAPIRTTEAGQPLLPVRSNPVAFGRVPFAHPAEIDFAGLLDFYRIRWEYEPTSFTLQTDRQGRVVQMFTPDFYLPEHDLYVELTTMKQSLITKKRGKIKRLKELHPDLNIVLMTRRDYYELLSQFGYGAVDITSLPEQHIERILFSPTEIAERVAELGAQISRDYAERSLILVGLLKGVTFFMADLARFITRPLAIDYLSVAPPLPDEGGRVRFTRDLDIEIAGQHVLLIEDIATTGLTLDFVVRHLHSRRPASLEVCVLFDKREVRLIDVPVRYTGFEIPNAFVVGYGLDYRERYRNLPFLCILRAEVYAQEHAGRLAEINESTQRRFGAVGSVRTDHGATDQSTTVDS
jgi:hypoxanthine phosphoribosyltransferase